MRALFKTCYALALHRVCARAGDSRLPPVLIIDTPTKNVSSVENPELTAAFFRWVYELAAGELVGTQFVIIDNEFNAVPQGIGLPMSSRQLVNGDPNNPPLIPYLVGDFSQCSVLPGAERCPAQKKTAPEGTVELEGCTGCNRMLRVATVVASG